MSNRGIFESIDWLSRQYKRLCCLIQAAVPSQTGHEGEFLTTDGTVTSWSPISLSRVTESSAVNTGPGNILTQDIQPGTITDAVLSTTKNGAMTTAVISKVGQFDKLAVTGGTSLSYIKFNDIFIADMGATFKITVKVENLNKDGVAGTSFLGFLGIGSQISGDAGSVWNAGLVANIIAKTVVKYGYNNNATAVTQTLASAGTLVTSGDVLDVEMTFDQRTGNKRLKVTNRTSGEYVYGISNGVTAIVHDFQMSNLALVASNADFTILDFKLYSYTNTPVVGFIGDNGCMGYNVLYESTLLPQLYALNPYNYGMYANNGASIYTIAARQIPQLTKTKPKFVIFAGITMSSSGDFRVASVNYTAWNNAFNNAMKQIIGYGGTPVLVKWSTGAFATYLNDWYTFVDNALVTYPTAKVLDLRDVTFNWGGGFGTPSAADMALMAVEIDNFLTTNGY